MLKRAFDVVAATLLLAVLSPFLLLLAVLVKLQDGGPAFYRGSRVGRYGQVFRIIKFRSMISNADRAGVSSSGREDGRITPLGKFLRRFKLDELPQLINVFLGQMSFVGPRPEVQKFVDMYTDEEKAILTVRPGITDWSSINFHDESEIISRSGMADADEAYLRFVRPEKIRLQLRYVRERSFFTDLKIIFATLGKLAATRGERILN
ncbi:MAG TPA: sugar transferase [Bryobacteraceae bacterium]|jgi:lipopolysaccharide/colanic/teichoic acid biosynthesis glycosyltransferase